MGKRLNPLEKEFLIRRFRESEGVKIQDFCRVNDITTQSLRKWMEQYDADGIEGLCRAERNAVDILPEGQSRSEENYKKEILRLRIENERLKKNYAVEMTEAGRKVYIPLRKKSTE